MGDLFQDNTAAALTGKDSYTAKDVEVLDGLEAVRRRPGMYVGGTDERALHHLAAEILDNAMDEATAGHASVIDFELGADNAIAVRDNGRGIPIDPHPKFPEKSALEVILTNLHSGGKFGGNAYAVAGGLHGVGLTVVNALSESLIVEVAREKRLWRQDYVRGRPLGPLAEMGAVPNRRGTLVRFRPDPEIFGTRLRFRPATLFRMARTKAMLQPGVRIRWSCDPALLAPDDPVPAKAELHYPGGLLDFLKEALGARALAAPPFAGRVDLPESRGAVEWALAWPSDAGDDDSEGGLGDGFFSSYCNTIPTPQGGTHETGFRTALTRALRDHGERVGNRKAAQVTAEDLFGGACVMLSLFLKDPQFQGQTKEKLVSAEATRLVEVVVKDHADHWLAGAPDIAAAVLDLALARAEERQRLKQAKELARKSATKRLRLPGKLTDCTRSRSAGTEVFLVEGDSAGGSAKMARDRETQAVLPLRGKILNVAAASADKRLANQELKDLAEALGCGVGPAYDGERLRYEKVIIMTDADVDGAHIAALLMTFFFREMPKLVAEGHLYLAAPPLYRLAGAGKVIYARDDAHKDELLRTVFKGRGGNAAKVEISRFKGLGEMPPSQLRETTMDPARRVLQRVVLPTGQTEEAHEDLASVSNLVERLMGRKPEARFQFIQERAKFAELDV